MLYSILSLLVLGPIAMSGHLFFPSFVHAQPAVNYPPVINPKDYFDKDHDHAAKMQVQNVEQYHLGAAFWANYASGRLDAALDDVQFVLRYVPNHPLALSLIGTIAKSKHSPSMALSYYENAIRLYPQHASTYAQYGKYLVDIGQLELGISRLRQATSLDPTLAVGYAWLAEAYLKNGDQDLAREAARQARNLGYNRDIPGPTEKLK